MSIITVADPVSAFVALIHLNHDGPIAIDATDGGVAIRFTHRFAAERAAARKETRNHLTALSVDHRVQRGTGDIIIETGDA